MKDMLARRQDMFAARVVCLRLKQFGISSQGKGFGFYYPMRLQTCIIIMLEFPRGGLANKRTAELC